jgi:hypothetical protein
MLTLSFRTLLVCDVHLTLHSIIALIMLQIFLKKNININSGNLLKKFLFLLAIIFCVGCGPDKEIIIQEKVTERLTAFREKKNAECRAELLVEAEQIVDSLLLAEATMELSDSLFRLRPFKPAKPAPLPPIDTLPVQPIFEPASSTGG